MTAMMTCVECGAELLAGAIFCNECGAVVESAGVQPAEPMEPPPSEDAAPKPLSNPVFTPAVQTSHMTRDQTPFVSGEPEDTSQPGLLGQDLGDDRPLRQITFVIPSSGRRVTLDLTNEIQIGRSDPANEYWPALDVTVDEGAQKGVSRRHAAIKLSNQGIVLVDLKSTNGTTLNGYRLPPDLPYPLNNGDEVSFARLLVHVFLD